MKRTRNNTLKTSEQVSEGESKTSRSNTKKRSKSKISPYTIFGLILSAIGVGLSVVAFFFIGNSLFTAIGVAIFVLGTTTLLLPNDPTPPQNLHAMLSASMYNVEAILDQFEAEEKAIYLPRRGGERSRACIPLKETADLTLLKRLIAAPASLIVDLDRKLWLMISIPIGYDLLDSINEDSSPEKALRYTLIEGLGLVQSLKEAKQGTDIVIEMRGSTLTLDLPHYNKILGTLQTSICGCILADEYNTPISLVEENVTPKATTAVFRVIKDE